MATSDPAASADRPSDFGADEAAVVARWISELDLARKGMESWHKSGEKIVKRYLEERSEATDTRKRSFCLLWANIQTLAPAVYARTPTAVVGRRWKDDDPVARVSSEALERAINFSLDAQDFADMMVSLRDEFLLVARGQAWVRYVPHMVTRTAQAAEPGAAPDGEISDNEDQYEEVIWEEAIADHVHWKDFFTNPARTWPEVRWVARRAYLDRDELTQRFGEKKGKACPLNWKLDSTTTTSGKEDTQFNKAEVFEIWDKRSRKVFWVNTAYAGSVLDERDDPLGLKDFFPCPRPLLGTCGPDSIIPRPDYVFYESQAREIDDLTGRIKLLTDALKVRGFYRGKANQKLTDLLSGETNTIIPIDDWEDLKDAGGAANLIQYLPTDMIANTLKSVIEVRQQMLEDVFQITGIADIMRGDSDPNETLGAQELKANWGSSRVRDKQKELGRFAKDLIRLMGEVIAKKFSADTLGKMTGIKLFPDPQAKSMVQQQIAMQMQAAAAAQAHAQQTQAPGQPAPPAPQPPPIPPQLQRMLGDPTWADIEAMLHDDALRSFRIDIETDSTIEPNDQQEKQRRVEFIEAVAMYLEKTLTIVSLSPAMLPVIGEGLKFLVRGFRVGREMEDVIETALEQAGKMAGQAPQQQQHGEAPQVQAAKAQAAVTGAQAKAMDAQTNRFRAETDRSEVQVGAQIEAHRLQQEGADAHLDRQADAAGQAADIRADVQKAVITAATRHLVRDINTPHLVPETRQ